MSKEKQTAERIGQRLDRSHRAETAMSFLEEAMKDLENQCIQKFRDSSLHDAEGHKAAKYYLRVLDDVRGRFASAIRDGKVANHDLVRMKKRLFSRTG